MAEAHEFGRERLGTGPTRDGEHSPNGMISTMLRPMSGYIDLRDWKHREHYELFRRFAQPFFSVCAEIDVTTAWNASRERGDSSFFLSAVYAVLQAANESEPFRLRLREDGVWKHDRLIMSTTILREDETFGFALLEPLPTFAEFDSHAREAIRAAKNDRGLKVREKNDAVVFHSTLPWIRFSAFSNALPLTDSVPRIVFGKCDDDGTGRITMPVAVEVHHAVVHGLDVARFLDMIQKHLQ